MTFTCFMIKSGRYPMVPRVHLVEVLVALIIIGVGMLGIAKIQALAYASTGNRQPAIAGRDPSGEPCRRDARRP